MRRVMSEILTKHGEVKALAKLTNRPERTVYNALKGRTQSELSIKIRTLAVKRGGVEVK